MQETPKRPRGRPQLRSDEETRRLILAAATRIFLAQGFGATSMEAVAQAAGVSKKTIYRFVDTKEHLLEAVIDTRSEALRSPIGHDAGADPEGMERALHQFLQELARLVLSEETVALNRLVYAESLRFPEMAKAFYQAGPVRNAEALAAWLETQRRHGVLRFGDAMETARMLVSMTIAEPLRAATLGVAPLPTPAEIDRRVDEAVEIFLRGCLVRR
ncbi:TetR/AcrR family transcriptional regulator [Inquilinus sp. Marseille-Q2685]|uniref:TetR/AcrR family transcriptional regulator n=1 Tax=Inquilinus sp. Marseille-Q2685 TaxID=2866581 RepID=UPI001CE44B77|nr:TetR/AcrR family transcriptional regulator [Inquilinus sp. Marseille-Q2685]